VSVTSLQGTRPPNRFRIELIQRRQPGGTSGAQLFAAG